MSYIPLTFKRLNCKSHLSYFNLTGLMRCFINGFLADSPGNVRRRAATYAHGHTLRPNVRLPHAYPETYVFLFRIGILFLAVRLILIYGFSTTHTAV